MADQQIPHVYTLTELTSAADQQRRVVILRTDLPRRAVVITVVTVAASFLPTVVLWSLMGPWALFFPAAAVLAAFYLIERRTATGLHLRTYQAMWDRRKSVSGKFICCGVEIQPRMSGYGHIVQAAMPSPFRSVPAASLDLFVGESARVRTAQQRASKDEPARAGGRSARGDVPPQTRRRVRSRKGADPFTFATDRR